MATSLIIETRNDDITKQKSLTDINPDATDDELKTFAQTLVDLTQNTYVQTNRIDKRNLDNDTRPTARVPSLWLHEYNGTGKAIQPSNKTFTIDINANNLWTTTISSVQRSQVRFNFQQPANKNLPTFTVPEGFAWTYLAENSNNAIINVTTPSVITEATTFEFDVVYPATNDYKELPLHFVVNVTVA